MKKPSRGTRPASRPPKALAFGLVLQDAIEKSGLTFGGLALRMKAQKVSISSSELWQIVQGNRAAPSAPVCYALARILKLDPLRLVELLMWSRANPTAGKAPNDMKAVGGTMLVTGLEEQFMMRFRNLNAQQTREVLRHFEIVEAVGGKVGAQDAGATFRNSDGK